MSNEIEMTEKWPYGKAYMWKGNVIGVVPGLGDNTFIVARKTRGGLLRYSAGNKVLADRVLATLGELESLSRTTRKEPNNR